MDTSEKDIGVGSSRFMIAVRRGLDRIDSVNAIVFFYACLLIFGVWHGFPALKVIGDEGLYVVAVLKTLQAYTIIPQGLDYSYTVSFYVNYALFIPFVSSLFLFFSGNMGAVIDFLTTHVYVAYVIPRLVGIAASVITLYMFLKLAKQLGRTGSESCVIALLVFTNLLFVMISHTGKMWSLSLLLWFLSFYFYTRACSDEYAPTAAGVRLFKHPAFWSPVFASLAFANFPMNVIVGLIVAALFFGVYKRYVALRPVVLGSVAGAVLFCTFFVLNYTGWTTQITALTPTGGTYEGIARYFFYGALFIMPLLLTYTISCAKFTGHSLSSKKRGLYLLVLSISFYVALVVLRAPWVGDNFGFYWRYFYYLIFMVGLWLLYFPMQRKYIAYGLVAIGVLCGMRMSLLLAVPTTYNRASSYLLENAGQTLIVSTVEGLDLAKNQEASFATREDRCGSRCQLARQGKYTGDTLFLIDGASDTGAAAKLLNENEAYYLVSSIKTGKGDLVFSVENGVVADQYLEVDYRLGLYDEYFFTADRIGTDIFIEKVHR